MIIKEYRIPLPMTVEEYRIAQLYMIQVGLGARAGHAGRTDGSRTLGWGGAALWSPRQCLLSRLLVSVSVARALWLPSPMPGTQRSAVGVCGIGLSRQPCIHGAGSADALCT